MRDILHVTVIISDPNSDMISYRTLQVDANLLSGVQTQQMLERQANFNRRVTMAANTCFVNMDKYRANPEEYNVIELQQAPDPHTMGECRKHGKVSFYLQRAGMKKDNSGPIWQKRCVVCKSEQQKAYIERRRLREEEESA